MDGDHAGAAFFGLTWKWNTACPAGKSARAPQQEGQGPGIVDVAADVGVGVENDGKGHLLLISTVTDGMIFADIDSQLATILGNRHKAGCPYFVQKWT